MEKWDTMTNAFNDYVNAHPTYKNIIFRYESGSTNSQLHPVFVMSQFIIDSLEDGGVRRSAVVLPDDQSQIITLVIAKYFQFLQDDPSYATSIFESITAGQHVKLGKAVAEFLELDREKRRIKYRVGKQTKLYGPTTISTPISNYHLLLEKTEADVSTEKKWGTEVKKIKDLLQGQSMDLYLDKFRQKRTGVKKTIVVLGQKNNIKQELASLIVNDQPIDDVLAYGELVDGPEKTVNVLNKGKLDCLPGISIANKLSLIIKTIKTCGADSISAIYCTQDKFSEIVDNLDAFRKILKAKIPVILFVPETEFEKYDVLRALGFVFWQWKPSTLKSGCFRVSDPQILRESIYSKLAKKVNTAAIASYKVVRCKSDGLSEIKNAINNLLREEGEDTTLRRILFRLNRFHKRLTIVCTELDEAKKESLLNEWGGISQDWKEVEELYTQNPCCDRINAILDALGEITIRQENRKADALKQCIKESAGDICVVLPDDYDGLESIRSKTANFYQGKKCAFIRFSEYVELSNRGGVFDMVFVPWFDNSKYIKLKQSYCYRRLVFILYDYENRWRSAFIKRIDTTFSHGELTETAKRVMLSPNSINRVPFDSVEIEAGTHDPTKEDYDFDRTLLKRVIGTTSSSSELADSVECVPVILSEETIAYFGTGHELIDVTDLCNGESLRAEKLPAEKLSQGRVILIRQSGRDLIAEKADQLMERDGKESLRETSSAWFMALSKYSAGKTIQEVTDGLTASGFPCSSQLVRSWILGETIRPNDINAIKAVAILCHDDKLKQSLKEVYAAGGAVQEYHRKAGRWLSEELKNRAADIVAIYTNGEVEGDLQGIGAIHLYKVEEVLSKEFVPRGKVNTLEVYA